MLLVRIALIAGFSGIAAAQANANLMPQCAQACLGSNLGGCNTVDIQCICSNESLIANLSCCVASTCSPNDIAATQAFANALCGSIGVTLPSAASCAPGVSSTTAIVGTGSAASSAASSISSVASSVQAGTSTGSTASAASAASRSVTSPVVQSSQAAAAVAAHLAGGAVGIGAAAVGVIALL